MNKNNLEHKLLYISGAGRSGSTILDIVLGDNDHVVGLGELNNLFTSGWTNNEYCSCGLPANDCDFWSGVKTKWEKGASLSIPEYIRLQKKFIRFRKLPLLWFQKIKKSKDFQNFELETKRLYRIIGKSSSSNVLVDSSKLPYRLYALKIMGLQPHVIHLVRDGRGVLNSLKKGFKADLKAGVQNDLKPKPTFRTALFWYLSNRMTDRIGKGLPYFFLRYENFMKNPVGELEKLEKEFDINLSQSKKDISENNPIQKRHTVAGNRLRMEKEIRLKAKPDEGWKQNLDRKDIALFEKVAGKMLKKYGYKTIK